MIRDIVFDIGRVFVEIDPRPILELLAEHAAPCTDLDSLIRSIALEDHECGRVAGPGLIARIAGLTGRPVAAELLHEKWLDMFELQPEMVELARALAERYRVYLLSNIGDLHWAHLCREYQIDALAHDALPSFVAGAMKPDAAIYLAAERRFGLVPGTTVFIDDRPENIAAAQARGWHGVLHRDHAGTVQALRALGIQA